MDTKMSAKSARFYERLKEANLFSKVGNVLEGNFRRVYSWDEAIQIFFDDDQDDAYTISSNEIRKQIPLKQYQQWNAKNEIAIKYFDPMVDKKLLEAIKHNKIPKELYDCKNNGIYWDIGMYVIECEFSEYVVPGIYETKAELYLQGFFPCGWDGEYPQGRLIVF